MPTTIPIMFDGKPALVDLQLEGSWLAEFFEQNRVNLFQSIVELRDRQISGAEGILTKVGCLPTTLNYGRRFFGNFTLILRKSFPCQSI